jgi:hypothetical protein
MTPCINFYMTNMEVLVADIDTVNSSIKVHRVVVDNEFKYVLYRNVCITL